MKATEEELLRNLKPEPTHEEWAKRFCIANGICWHEVKFKDFSAYFSCSCGKSYSFESSLREHIRRYNPTFTNPADIFEVIMKRKDYKLFMAKLEYGDFPNVEEIDWTGYIDVDYITEKPPTRFVKESTLWCEKE